MIFITLLWHLMKFLLSIQYGERLKLRTDVQGRSENRSVRAQEGTSVKAVVLMGLSLKSCGARGHSLSLNK